jgi:hypothetical protein
METLIYLKIKVERMGLSRLCIVRVGGTDGWRWQGWQEQERQQESRKQKEDCQEQRR